MQDQLLLPFLVEHHVISERQSQRLSIFLNSVIPAGIGAHGEHRGRRQLSEHLSRQALGGDHQAPLTEPQRQLARQIEIELGAHGDLGGMLPHDLADHVGSLRRVLAEHQVPTETAQRLLHDRVVEWAQARAASPTTDLARHGSDPHRAHGRRVAEALREYNRSVPRAERLSVTQIHDAALRAQVQSLLGGVAPLTPAIVTGEGGLARRLTELRAVMEHAGYRGHEATLAAELQLRGELAQAREAAAPAVQAAIDRALADFDRTDRARREVALLSPSAERARSAVHDQAEAHLFALHDPASDAATVRIRLAALLALSRAHPSDFNPARMRAFVEARLLEHAARGLMPSPVPAGGVGRQALAVFRAALRERLTAAAEGLSVSPERLRALEENAVGQLATAHLAPIEFSQDVAPPDFAARVQAYAEAYAQTLDPPDAARARALAVERVRGDTAAAIRQALLEGVSRPPAEQTRLGEHAQVWLRALGEAFPAEPPAAARPAPEARPAGEVRPPSVRAPSPPATAVVEPAIDTAGFPEPVPGLVRQLEAADTARLSIEQREALIVQLRRLVGFVQPAAVAQRAREALAGLERQHEVARAEAVVERTLENADIGSADPAAVAQALREVLAGFRAESGAPVSEADLATVPPSIRDQVSAQLAQNPGGRGYRGDTPELLRRLSERLRAAGVDPVLIPELARRAVIEHDYDLMVARAEPAGISLPNIPPDMNDPVQAVSRLLTDRRAMTEFMAGVWREMQTELDHIPANQRNRERAALLRVLRRRAEALGLLGRDPATRPESVARVLDEATEFGPLLETGRLFFDQAFDGNTHGNDTHILQILMVAPMLEQVLRSRIGPPRQEPTNTREFLQWLGRTNGTAIWGQLFDAFTNDARSPEVFGAFLTSVLLNPAHRAARRRDPHSAPRYPAA